MPAPEERSNFPASDAPAPADDARLRSRNGGRPRERAHAGTARCARAPAAYQVQAGRCPRPRGLRLRAATALWLASLACSIQGSATPPKTPVLLPAQISIIICCSRVGYLLMISPPVLVTTTVSEWRKPPKLGS